MSTVTKCDRCKREIPPGTPERRVIMVGAVGSLADPVHYALGWELRFEVQRQFTTHGDICNDCAWGVLGQALAQYHADKQAEVNRRLDDFVRKTWRPGGL